MHTLHNGWPVLYGTPKIPPTPSRHSFRAFTARNLVPSKVDADAAIFDDLVNELAFSTGSFFGDGRQASHWKDDGITGNLLGVMDPTFGPGSILSITEADLRALDVIGYDYVVPVLAAFWLFASGLIGLIGIRKNKAKYLGPE